MKIGHMRSIGLRIVAFAAAALFSTVALAMSLTTWQFTGWSTDEIPVTATMTFDTLQQGQVITETQVIRTESFAFTELSFQLGDDLNPIAQGVTGIGSIVQTDWLGTTAVFTDTYSIEGIFTSNAITSTLTMNFAKDDLFNSLLTDVGVLQGALPGVFELFSPTITSTLVVAGTIQSVSDLTAIPAPWTLGLMLSGLGSIGFLSVAAWRARRAR